MGEKCGALTDMKEERRVNLANTDGLWTLVEHAAMSKHAEETRCSMTEGWFDTKRRVCANGS